MTRAIAWFALLLVLGLGGCVHLGGQSDALRIVAPLLDVESQADWPTVNWTLLVQRPVADKTRGSARIVVRSEHARLAYYPGVAWLDELPEMLQTLVLQAFTDTGRLAGVARPGVARARYSLATEVRRFEVVDEDRGALAVELEVHATLLEVRSGKIVGDRVVATRVPIGADGVDALTDGFETALDTLIGELIGWTLAAAPAGTSDVSEDTGR